jgi:hypothetical protein
MLDLKVVVLNVEFINKLLWLIEIEFKNFFLQTPNHRCSINFKQHPIVSISFPEIFLSYSTHAPTFTKWQDPNKHQKLVKFALIRYFGEEGLIYALIEWILLIDYWTDL